MNFLLVFTVCSMVTTNCLDTLSTGKKFDTFKECSMAGYDLIKDQALIFPPLQFEIDKPAFLFDCIEIPNQSI
jgi:hypothetical protein